MSAARVLAVPTDVSVESSVDALFRAAVERFGRVDLLFNNAGMNATPAPFDSVTLAQWNDTIAINLTGAFSVCPRGLSPDEGAEPARRAASSTTRRSRRRRRGRMRRLCRQQARRQRAVQVAVARRPRPQHRLLSDRHRQCGDHDVGAERRARYNPTAASAPSRGSIPATSRTRCSTWRTCRSIANVPHLTVMATNMPFAGRG